MRRKIFAMNKLYFCIALAFFGACFNAFAQPQTGEFINASIGVGACFPNDETDIIGDGFYAQAEYVWAPLSWFGVRPYAGVIIASGESEDPELQGYKVKSNAALLGAKVRLAAPIPYVAPFIESGIGLSAGSFETYTPFTNLKKSGVLLHVPLTLGLAIGRRHNYEVKFTYYYHNAVKQVSGAAAIGFTLPINED